MSAATVTWDERDSSATSSAGRFLADDFLPLVLNVSNAQDDKDRDRRGGSSFNRIYQDNGTRKEVREWERGQ